MKKLIVLLFILTGFTGCGNDESTAPNKATAKCADGTFSYSQSCSGTCSGHGGVVEWMGVLSGCGNSVPQSPPISVKNDIPKLSIANVSPAIFQSTKVEPFSKKFLFDLITSDETANINYLSCNIYRSTGELISGGWDFNAPLGVTTLHISNITMYANIEKPDTLMLKCGANDNNGNKTSATSNLIVL